MEQIQAGGGGIIFVLCFVGLLIATFILAVIGILKPIIIRVLFEEYPSFKNLTESQIRKLCSGVIAAYIVVGALGLLIGGPGRTIGFFTILAFLSLYLFTLSIGITGLIFPGIVKRLFHIFGDRINYSLLSIRIICICLIIIVVLFGKIFIWSQQ